ncbi:MAG: TIGR03885 family FMN-dependent LLM class oxidoreductase [Flavobacterium sp.]|nr:TIGR03885 family FMN-dependent LLM class oxidoreductase [Flavobacterium sp.]
MKIGYHASHEQFSPRELLQLVQKAEQAGFTCALSSDHFHPWSNTQGESGFAWSWLGAAMQATNLEFGIVNAPGQRYHPAIIAQAVATLDQMFPARFWIAAGSGQALNENITGDKWPEKEIRNKRLKESVEVMRELWKGDYVTHHGEITVENAKLFTVPETSPMILGAALTQKTAQWIAPWTDGLITVSQPMDGLRKFVHAYRQVAGPHKPMILKVQISFERNYETARTGAWEQWKNNIFPSSLLSDITTPDKFDALGQNIRKEDVAEKVLISDSADFFIQNINEFAGLGFDKIIIHNVNHNQESFIEFFGSEVLPSIKQTM